MQRGSRPSRSIVLFVGLALLGCGGGSPQQITPRTVPFTSGLYQIFANTPDGSLVFKIYGSLMQNGNSVSGVMHTAITSCLTSASDIPVTGSLLDDASLTVNLSATLPSGQTLTFKLTHPGGDLTTVGGTFAITGTGCAGTAQGVAAGSSLKISGLWNGVLTPVSGAVCCTIQLNLTQTGPDAHGFFSATGTATIVGGTCFGSASMDPSTVIGSEITHFVMNGSQAGTTGKLTLEGVVQPASFGGAHMAGLYTSVLGSCTDSGIVRIDTVTTP